MGAQAKKTLHAVRRQDVTPEPTRLKIIKDAVEALDRASSALRQEEGDEEWGFPDIKRGIDLYDEVGRYEVDLIKRALRESCDSLTKAARLLGVSPSTLSEKLKRHQIVRATPRRADRKGSLTA